MPGLADIYDPELVAAAARQNSQDSIFGGPKAALSLQASRLKPGYYRLPGSSEAVYVDPRTGGVPRQVIEAGLTEKDMVAPADSGDTFRKSENQSPEFIDAFNAQLDLGKTGLSRQEAQEKRLSMGAYQRGVVGVQGTQNLDPATGLPKPRGPSSAALPDTSAGAPPPQFDADGNTSAAYMAWSNSVAGRMFFNKKQTDVTASAAALDQKNGQAFTELRAQRKARGLDEMTGIGAPEQNRIADTLARISDPAQRAAFLRYQDTGNLSAEARTEQRALKADERASVLGNSNSTTEYYTEFAKSGGKAQFKATRGGKFFGDPGGSGREIFSGNAVTDISVLFSETWAQKWARTTVAGQVTSRAIGGAVGFATGFIAGGTPGAIIGAYMGAGGPLPNLRDVNMKSQRGLELNQWHFGQPHIPSGKEIALGTALGYVSHTGGAAGAAAKNRAAGQWAFGGR